MTEESVSTLEKFDQALAAHEHVRFELTLFVSGASDLAARAIANAREICDSELDGDVGLVVVDVHGNPAAMLASGILATPTLVRNWPLPVRRVVGDLSRTDKVLLALELLADAPTRRTVESDDSQASA